MCVMRVGLVLGGEIGDYSMALGRNESMIRLSRWSLNMIWISVALLIVMISSVFSSLCMIVSCRVYRIDVIALYTLLPSFLMISMYLSNSFGFLLYSSLISCCMIISNTSIFANLYYTSIEMIMNELSMTRLDVNGMRLFFLLLIGLYCLMVCNL